LIARRTGPKMQSKSPRLWTLIEAEGARKMKSSPRLKTVTEGRIASMNIPADWQESPQTGEEGARYTREVCSAGSSAVKICIHFRGNPLSPISAACFRQLLLKPAHNLSSVEQSEMDDVVGNAAIPEYFSLQSLRTAVLNERTVLLLEGLWAGGNRSLQLYL